MNKAYQLLAAAVATIVWLDASQKPITPPKGSTIAWVSSDETFATVAPIEGSLTQATVTPVTDADGQPVEGSAVISATLTNPDGTQAIVTGAVSDVDDVSVGTMTFAPVDVQSPTP